MNNLAKTSKTKSGGQSQSQPRPIKQETMDSSYSHGFSADAPAVGPSTSATSASASASSMPPPSMPTSSFAGSLQSTTNSDMRRIRNSLNAIVVHPREEDIAENSRIRPPNSEPTNCWCMVYYYELNERVGEVFKSEWKAVGNGDQSQENAQLIIDGGVCASSENTRFCLGVIGNINRNPIVTKVSRSIGKGLRLYQRDGNIFLECLSDSALFVQCPLFARKNNDELATVYKLKIGESGGSSANSPAGSSEPVCLFDMKLYEEMMKEAQIHGYNALYMLQVYCLCRISFVKGWGQQYRRQTITSCPMWIEIQFPRPLQMLDEIMMEYADQIGDEEVRSFS